MIKLRKELRRVSLFTQAANKSARRDHLDKKSFDLVFVFAMKKFTIFCERNSEIKGRQIYQQLSDDENPTITQNDAL